MALDGQIMGRSDVGRGLPHCLAVTPSHTPLVRSPRVDRAGAERAVRGLLSALGQDVDSERLARVPAELVCGLEKLLVRPAPQVMVHRSGGDPGGLTVHNVRYLSLCPHLSPARGVAHIGYLPHAYCIGGDQLEQVVAYLAHRPELPGELAVRVADWVDDLLRPKGCAVLLEGRNNCLAGCAGDAGQPHETDLASRGLLRDDHLLRRDFLACCRT